MLEYHSWQKIYQQMSISFCYFRIQRPLENTVTNYRVDLEQFREYLLRQGISDVSGIDSQSVRVYLSNIIGFGIANRPLQESFPL